MRPIELKFTKTDLVSTEYDPKTKGDGAKTSYALWYSTDYIDISGEYALYFNLAGHRYIYSLWFYDAEKNFLSGEGLRTTSRCATLRSAAVVPENAVYVRCANFVNGNETFKDPFLEALPRAEDYALFEEAHPLLHFTVACLGDSLTEGDRGSSAHGISSMGYRNYPFRLAETLSCTTLNYGKCGYAVSDYLGHYASGEVDIGNADLILVMLGTNVGMKERAQQLSYTNLLRRIERGKKEGAAVVLITPPHATNTPGKASYGHGYPENALSSAEYQRAFAEEHGYLLIDAYKDSPITEENEALYQSNDGLHMNEEGYRVFAAFIAEQLRELGVIPPAEGS